MVIQFTYTPGATDASGRINTYGITATPISVGTTGTNFYYTDDVRRDPSKQHGGGRFERLAPGWLDI